MKCRAKRESVRVRVVTWNLYGGRAKPAAGRSLLREFSTTLAGWEWDVAMLQEVPPWWPPELARAAGAEQRRVLTARNWGRPIRRWLGERDPDRWGSWAGGSNAILVRVGAAGGIAEHRTRRLRWLPERRWMHGVRLQDGTWVVNMHLTVPAGDPAQRDLGAALEVALEWAGDAPLVFGGDVNQRQPRVPGLAHLAARNVDHLFARGFASTGPVEVLDHGTLSDHAPLALDLRRSG
jgi:endonuclease/exonuclease/phosphatase family metal-dependent hydrolase